MRVKLLLFSIFLVFIASCTYEGQNKATIYTIEESEPTVFVVGEDIPSTWEKDTMQHRNELNKIRALRDFEDKEEEFEIKSKMKNVRRVIDDKLVVGYDKELDNPDFKEVE